MYYTHTHRNTHTHSQWDPLRVGGQGPGMSIQYCSLETEASYLGSRRAEGRYLRAQGDVALHCQDAIGISMDGRGTCRPELLSLKQIGG